MKKTIAVLLVMGALFSGNQMFATGNNSNPTGKPAKIMQISFDNVSNGSRLYIKDSNDQILYSETIESEGYYSKGYDFSFLPSDEYYFELDKEAFISIHPFSVKEEQVVFNQELNREILKPLLVLEDNRVKLMRNLDQKQALKVKIYYQGQDLVYSETIRNDGNIGRIYDLSTSSKGDYLFSIEYDDREYHEYMSINTNYQE